MLIYKELRWGNIFSYGPINKLVLNDSPLIQLLGANGHGKSSIALILEEVLFSQNSKKIKKGSILNRYVKDKSYFIELDVDKDGITYEIRTTRTNTTNTVKLLRQGEDISSHTATGTYKLIEELVGYDHKTFSQIVYQSSLSSLAFLTATDTERKKFLIDLLNLGRYTKASEVFRALSSAASKEVTSAESKVETVRSWLSKYETSDFVLEELEDEPKPPDDLVEYLAGLKDSIANIESLNKKILANNKNIGLSIVLLEEPTCLKYTQEELTELNVRLANIKSELANGSTLASKCKGPITKCTTCSQDIDHTTMYNMVLAFNTKKVDLETELKEVQNSINIIVSSNKLWGTYDNACKDKARYTELVDPKLPLEVQLQEDLEKDIIILSTKISEVRKSIAKIRESNTAKLAHNARVESIKSQMQEMQQDLKTYSALLDTKSAEYSKLQVLVKALSTTGLVAYKIECLVKDLENIANEYLTILSSGRFQLSFKVTSSDKLNVVITDNGEDIEITALSSGERSRVNISTLLAIRKLMQSLSNSRTNLLILDETVENLDAQGKESLVEVLLEEKLNTILVSHSFSHPLIERVQVIKEDNISRLEV
jgi:DNA repair exonuclease SbcCD ATPase subunit